jgi:hypothetical protein
MYNPINNLLKNILTMKPTNLLLTKEAFDQYAIRLREEQARKYGMTLEQWDAAVATQQVISYNTQHNSGSKNA